MLNKSLQHTSDFTMSNTYYGPSSHFQPRYPVYADLSEPSTTGNTHMPPIKKITKSCCPLCEELQELKFRYDICETCHEDIINGKDSEYDPDSKNGDDSHMDDDDESDDDTDEDQECCDDSKENSTQAEDVVSNDLPKEKPKLNSN